jgi:hypothetical protein
MKRFIAVLVFALAILPGAGLAGETPGAAPGHQGQLTSPGLDIALARLQFEKCWNAPYGPALMDLSVAIKISIDPDGMVEAAQIIQDPRHSADPAWQAVAVSALRAIHNPACSPLRLPAGDYANWKYMTIVFSIRDIG